MKTSKIILIGHLWVTLSAFIVMCITVTIPIAILLKFDLPGELMLIGGIIPIGFGILVYSFLIVKWKIWALTRADNVRELLIKGERNGLLPPNSIQKMRKNKVMSKSDRAKLEKLYQRLEDPTPRSFNEQEGIVVGYSKTKNYIYFTLCIAASVFILLSATSPIVSYGLSILAFFVGAFFLKRALSKSIYLKINIDGVLYEENLISWSNIARYDITTKFINIGKGSAPIFYLILWLKNREKIEINIQDKSRTPSAIEYAIIYFFEKANYDTK